MQTTMQTQMTADARERIETYLRRVRASVAGVRGVEAEEVVEGIREHLAEGLADAPEPVTRSTVEGLLDDLGAPDSWIDHDGTGWRSVMARLHRGPEDWRLPYLALGTFLLGFAFGGTLWFLLLASFVLARAGVEVVLSAEGSLEGRRWLLYPPLLTFYLGVAPALFLWPLAAVHAGISPGGFLVDVIVATPSPSGLLATDTWLAAGPWAGMGLGLWLLVLGLTARIWPGWLPAVFRPFADGVSAAHLAGPGASLAVIAAGLLVLL